MEKKRSFGVTVIGILFIIFAFSFYLEAIIYCISKSIPLASLVDFIIQKYKSNLLFPLLQLILIVCAVGVLQLKEWARRLVVYFSFSIFLVSVLSIVLLYPPLPLFVKFIGVIFYAFFYYYFTRPKVKEQFR